MEINLSESLEDYLEAIYKIILEKNGVRVKDIAKQLKVKNSSVTAALKHLASNGYINYEPYGIISLTVKGNEISKEITEKHRILNYFFNSILMLDKSISNDIACKMEHILPEDVFKKFELFINFFTENPEILHKLKQFIKEE